MTDLFAVLGEPRRPWLDTDALKKKFLQLSASVHPDRAKGSPGSSQQLEAQRSFTELNTAYRCLQDPQQRLKHLLELETGSSPQQVSQIPSRLMDEFLGIGEMCRATDRIISANSAATSPLLKVELFTQAQQSVDRLSQTNRKLADRYAGLLQQVQDIDSRWMQNQEAGLNQPADLISQLAELYRLLGYIQRWSRQLQERIVQLSF